MTIFIAILIIGFIVCMILLAGMLAGASENKSGKPGKPDNGRSGANEESARIKKKG